jgi:hypothetical protein
MLSCDGPGAEGEFGTPAFGDGAKCPGAELALISKAANLASLRRRIYNRLSNSYKIMKYS